VRDGSEVIASVAVAGGALVKVCLELARLSEGRTWGWRCCVLGGSACATLAWPSGI
jgi:hypothetical protein